MWWIFTKNTFLKHYFDSIEKQEKLINKPFKAFVLLKTKKSKGDFNVEPIFTNKCTFFWPYTFFNLKVQIFFIWWSIFERTYLVSFEWTKPNYCLWCLPCKAWKVSLSLSPKVRSSREKYWMKLKRLNSGEIL